MIQQEEFGLWSVQYDAADGARLGALSYSGNELLTGRSDDIKLPKGDYGKYETRLAYGYDDCFPTVDTAIYPGLNWQIPDHGELCWLPWEVKSKKNELKFTVESKVLPVGFTREMIFERDQLIWIFEVRNSGEKQIPFQHVMHPLMPLEDIKNISLPEFRTVWDDINGNNMIMESPGDVGDYLLSVPRGKHQMLFLQELKEGMVSWRYTSGLQIQMVFDEKVFPSLGIWWDNHSYPDEDHSRRTECAFEPTPGSNSNLADAYKDNTCMIVQPGTTLKWRIIWNIINI